MTKMKTLIIYSNPMYRLSEVAEILNESLSDNNPGIVIKINWVHDRITILNISAFGKFDMQLLLNSYASVIKKAELIE